GNADLGLALPSQPAQQAPLEQPHLGVLGLALEQLLATAQRFGIQALLDEDGRLIMQALFVVRVELADFLESIPAPDNLVPVLENSQALCLLEAGEGILDAAQTVGQGPGLVVPDRRRLRIDGQRAIETAHRFAPAPQLAQGSAFVGPELPAAGL